MSSLQSLRELISERLAAAAEEIFRLCEGTIVQYEQELCRQRRLLDICWKPQLQLHHIDLPQHCVTKEEDLCNQQTNSRVEQEEPEPPQIEKELAEPESPRVKEEQVEHYIIQDEEQLDLKQEINTLMEIPTHDEHEHNVADLINKQSLYLTDNQDEKGNQHEESTTNEETDPQNRDQRKKRDRNHVQSVVSSHMSESQSDSKKELLVKKHTQSSKEKSLFIIKSMKRTRIAPNVLFQMRTPSDKRCYTCEECSKSFGYWSQLRLHMRIHTGEKPFPCKECAKSFSCKSNLKSHMRTHTGEKPFTCKLCDVSFSYKCNLKTHMKVHTGNRLFSL